jgi:hypothetical protein
MKNILPRVRLAVLCAAVLATSVLVRADYYVAPTAVGTGAGTSATNAAGYLNLTFWNSTVKPALSSGALTVWFANGTYNVGQLKLTAFGHPLNKCTLKATTSGSVTLSTTSSFQSILWLYGCQNMELNGIRFTGASSQSAMNLSYYPSVLKSGTRNITVMHCWFENLTNLSLGAVTTGANHRVTFDTCHFSSVTGPAPKQVHAIYGGGASEYLSILNCDFTNIGGEYVRFRNDTDYAIVDNCSFHSTAAAWNSPFITVPLYNSISPYANEFYGTNYQFSNNVCLFTSLIVGNLTTFFGPNAYARLLAFAPPIMQWEHPTIVFSVGVFANIVVGSLWFFGSSLWYRRQPEEYHARVEDFFLKLRTPIAAAEKAGDNADHTQYRTLGLLCTCYGGFILLLMLIPNPLIGRLAFLFVGGTIGGIGLWLLRQSRKKAALLQPD